MTTDITPFRGGLRLRRDTEQALDYQDHVAMVRARAIQSIGFVTEVALLQVASLSNLEGELVKQVPLAAPRLEAIVNTATGVIAGQLARLARDLG